MPESELSHNYSQKRDRNEQEIDQNEEGTDLVSRQRNRTIFLFKI